jgi:hypothetical protein
MSVSLFLSVAVMTARKEAQRTKKHDRSQGLYNRMGDAPGLLQRLARRGIFDWNWPAAADGDQ